MVRVTRYMWRQRETSDGRAYLSSSDCPLHIEITPDGGVILDSRLIPIDDRELSMQWCKDKIRQMMMEGYHE